MKLSSIGWADYSGEVLNPAIGCTPVSEGCAHCYARAIYERFGRDFSKVTYSWEKLEKMARMRIPQYSPKRGAPYKPIMFPFDMTDLFHPDIPADFITATFDIMNKRSEAEWVILTKRPERMVEVLFGQEGDWYLGGGDYIPNIRLMVTVENQARFDERVPLLLKTWSGPTGVCCEPLLGPINAETYLWPFATPDDPLNSTLRVRRPALGLAVCGAESGPNRRPFKVEWALDLYEQCRGAGVPFYGKQDSALRPGALLLLPGYGIVHEWPKEEV